MKKKEQPLTTHLIRAHLCEFHLIQYAYTIAQRCAAWIYIENIVLFERWREREKSLMEMQKCNMKKNVTVSYDK